MEKNKTDHVWVNLKKCWPQRQIRAGLYVFLVNHFVMVILDSIAYIGPSVTTFQGHNPGYRIYEVDGDYANSSRVKTLPFKKRFLICSYSVGLWH